MHGRIALRLAFFSFEPGHGEKVDEVAWLTSGIVLPLYSRYGVADLVGGVQWVPARRRRSLERRPLQQAAADGGCERRPAVPY
jgi:hypothetical protein